MPSGVDTAALTRGHKKKARTRQHLLDAALRAFAANGVETMISQGGEYTPTPAVSQAILVHNRGRQHGLATRA